MLDVFHSTPNFTLILLCRRQRLAVGADDQGTVLCFPKKYDTNLQ